MATAVRHQKAGMYSILIDKCKDNDYNGINECIFDNSSLS